MKKKMLLLLLAVSLSVSCSTTGEDAAMPQKEHCIAEDKAGDEEGSAIFFFTKDTGIVAIETMDGIPYMTIPRRRTFLAPMRTYISEGGEPIFTCSEEGVNVKVYSDRVFWSRWGKAEYAAWNFTESPKDFYLKF